VVKPGQEAPNLQGVFFAQLAEIRRAVPEFSLEDVVYRTRKGFRIVGKIKQPLDTFQHAGATCAWTPKETPEMKFDLCDRDGDAIYRGRHLDGRKAGGIRIDPKQF